MNKSSHGRPPAHPGEFIVDCVFPALNIELIELADRMGIAPNKLLQVVEGRASVDRPFADKLVSAVGNGSPQFWLMLQKTYDEWHNSAK